MAPKNFSLSSLVPIEELTFTDDAPGGDGAVYACRTPGEFDSFEYAKLAKLQSDIPQIIATIGTMQEQAQIGEAIVLLDTTLVDLFTLIVPELPEMRVKRIPTAAKIKFFQWWQQERPQGPKAEDQQKVAKIQRGKRSPASARPTQG